MTGKIIRQIHEAADRLASKGLFGKQGDQLSMRVPGTGQFVILDGPNETQELFDIKVCNSSIHAKSYALREDAGAVLITRTDWSQCLFQLGVTPPTLFDEQARHIGKIYPPIADDNPDAILQAFRARGNIILCGQQCICIGSTKDRLVFNSELFQKCANAFLIAQGTGKKIRTIPFWVKMIAGNRLKKDQQRAAISYAQGKIPEGMNAY